MGTTLRALTRIGPARVARVAAHRAWSDSVSLGLRADLDRLPPKREAKVPVVMERVELPSFDAFADGLGAAEGEEALELLQRELMRESGVEMLLVAFSPERRPMYAQWLVLADDQDALERATGGLFPRLAAGEALVEGAYTFPDFRGLSVMADGMWQLLARARELGCSRVYTYVGPDNVASLKGCARAGFELDHVRVAHRRAGRTRIEQLAPDTAAGGAWSLALA